MIYMKIIYVLRMAIVTIKKIWNILVGIISFLIVIGFVILILYIGWYAVTWFWKSITTSPPVCHYNYVDANGVEGTAKECQGRFDNIYCGTGNELHLVVSVEKVCE